ncbi:MAG: hypoxanthine phosphoribosyltransferase [Tissierellia bacterium]|nr:hypoxanthine phosphoribosyltransferase [Tissierellia bacterium]
MHKDIEKILLTEEEIKGKAKEMGEKITKDYSSKDLYIICILKGGVFFTADLVRYINLPVNLDFMDVTSYGDQTISTGEVKIVKDLDSSVVGKDVLIVEDIIDTGMTLSYLTKNLKQRGARSVEIATLLDKFERRKNHVDVKYSGFEIPNVFVVGYGLDYAEKYRNLPYIGYLKPEVYQK